jgi:hypothetical protein
MQPPGNYLFGHPLRAPSGEASPVASLGYVCLLVSVGTNYQLTINSFWIDTLVTDR